MVTTLGMMATAWFDLGDGNGDEHGCGESWDNHSWPN